MKPADPAFDRLATAKRLLLDPYGLDESRLQQVLASIFEHRADFADLYFQYTRSESFSLEEGIVKSGSFDIEQGVGVRAVAGDKTAFAYSDDISVDSLAEAARVLILEDIPRLSRSNFNEARRFVILIDALYEARVRLICSAAAEPEMLYVEGEGTFEFERTASRLREMQSDGWASEG